MKNLMETEMPILNTAVVLVLLFFAFFFFSPEGESKDKTGSILPYMEGYIQVCQCRKAYIILQERTTSRENTLKRHKIKMHFFLIKCENGHMTNLIAVHNFLKGGEGECVLISSLW